MVNHSRRFDQRNGFYFIVLSVLVLQGVQASIIYSIWNYTFPEVDYNYQDTDDNYTGYNFSPNISLLEHQKDDEQLIESLTSTSSPATLGITGSVPNRTVTATASIYGLRVENASKPVEYDGAASVILANTPTEIRFFGEGFTPKTIIRFVTKPQPRGSDCDKLLSNQSFTMNEHKMTLHSAVATVKVPTLRKGQKQFYLCVKESDIDMPWTHQGPDRWITLKSYKKWLPLWAHILLIAVLLLLSGLFSGLNLGLLAMDRTDIKNIEVTGTDKEKNHAKKVKPLRKNGNFLLCSLIMANTMFNSTLTILLDDITSGLIAVIGSTVGIVIFGEIIPQAFCSRYGLQVGAYTHWITKFTMVITFPLSYPVAFILTKILGEI